MRVEQREGRLDDRDRLVVHRLANHVALRIAEHGGDVEPQVLRVQLRREGVRQGLALAGGDLHAVALRGEVAHDDGRVGRAGRVGGGQQRATNDRDVDRGGLVVGDV